MSSPDNFFERLRDFSGDREFCKKRGNAFKNSMFWLSGMRLQDDGIGIELIDTEGYDCECFIGISDLVDGFEDFIKYSHPEDAEKYKESTLSALRDAIARIESVNNLFLKEEACKSESQSV